MSIRVMLVDDQPDFREGMAQLLGAEDDLEVVAEAGNGSDGLRLAMNTRPDVVLMDLRMPVMDGVEATKKLRRALPQTKIIALTTFDDDQLVFDVLREGALSYLLKDASAEQVAEAIRAATEGRSVLSKGVTDKVVSEFARMAKLSPRVSTEELGLSPREAEILRLVANARSNKEIAGELHIAEGTVKNHLTNIFSKLGVHDRTHAALFAREHGLA